MSVQAGTLPNKAFAFTSKDLNLFPHHTEAVMGRAETKTLDIDLLVESFYSIDESPLSAKNKQKSFNHLKAHAKDLIGRLSSDTDNAQIDELKTVLNEFETVEWADYEPPKALFKYTKDEKLLKVGKWNDSEFTLEDLHGMADTYNKVDYEPPLKRSHVQLSENALGYASGLYVSGDYLIAKEFKYPVSVYENEIESKTLRYKSSEVYKNYEQDGIVYPYMLKAVALLGISTPAVVGLQELNTEMFSSDSNPHVSYYVFDSETDSILTKKGNRKEEEMADVIKNESGVSAEQFSALEARLKAQMDAFDAYKATADAAKELAEEKAANATAKVEEFAAKVSEMQSKVDNANAIIANLNEEGRKSENANFAANLVKDGKLAPKDLAAVEAILEAIQNDKGVAMFSADESAPVETDALEIFKSFCNGLKAWDGSEMGKDNATDVAPVVPGKDASGEKHFTTDCTGKKVEVVNVDLADMIDTVIKEFKAEGKTIDYRAAARIADKRLK